MPLAGAGDCVDGGVGEFYDLRSPPRLRRLLLLQKTYKALDGFLAHRHTLLIALAVSEVLRVGDVERTPEKKIYLWLQQELKEWQCMSVPSAASCLELTIFIFWAQIRHSDMSQVCL